MYLSYLIYRCAKAAADYGDPSFSYENFLTGKSAEDEDYSAFIDKSLPVVNEFIQRCYELNKLPAEVVSLGTPDENGLLTLPDDFGKSISLFQFNKTKTDYAVMAFRKMGKKLIPLFNNGKEFYFQYRKKVPYFTEADYPHDVLHDDDVGEPYYSYNGNNYETIEELQQAEDIELEETYGFSDTLASICVEFVQGRLMDERSEGHSREIEAESRLADVTLDETLFLQKTIVRKFR